MLVGAAARVPVRPRRRGAGGAAVAASGAAPRGGAPATSAATGGVRRLRGARRGVASAAVRAARPSSSIRVRSPSSRRRSWLDRVVDRLERRRPPRSPISSPTCARSSSSARSSRRMLLFGLEQRHGATATLVRSSSIALPMRRELLVDARRGAPSSRLARARRRAAASSRAARRARRASSRTCGARRSAPAVHPASDSIRSSSVLADLRCLARSAITSAGAQFIHSCRASARRTECAPRAPDFPSVGARSRASVRPSSRRDSPAETRRARIEKWLQTIGERVGSRCGVGHQRDRSHLQDNFGQHRRHEDSPATPKPVAVGGCAWTTACDVGAPLVDPQMHPQSRSTAARRPAMHRAPSRSTTTRSSGVTSTFDSPLGVTRIAPSASRTETLPSGPAMSPRSYSRRQTRTIAAPRSLALGHRAAAQRSRVDAVHDAASDDASQRTRPCSVWPAYGVFRPFDWNCDGSTIHSTSGSNTVTSAARASAQRSARQLEDARRRARHPLDQQRQVDDARASRAR